MLSRLLILIVVLSASALAQDARFPSRDYFRQQWTKPPLQVETPPLLRLEDFAAGGRLELSLRSYIELVMANNTDVAIQKLTLLTAQNAIQRAFAPFDPTFQASFNNSRSSTPSNDLLAGAAVLGNLSQRANFSYTQTMESGTQYTVGFFGNKTANNSQFTNFNPSIQTNLQFNVTQPLLRNRGMFINRVPILMARSRLRVTGTDLRQRVTDLLTQAENGYWDVIDARETLRVREKALELSEAFLKRSTRELELGAISPLDIFQPQQQHAAAQVAVTQASYRLKQREDALRRWIGADLHPEFRKLPLELTETVMPPSEGQAVEPEDAVTRALRLRPEMEGSRFNTDVIDLQIQQATNALRPDLSLGANYTSQGRGGNFFQRAFPGTGGTSTTTLIPGGFGDSLDQLFHFRFPIYGFTLNLRLPLRDRRAASDLSDAVVSKRRDALAQRGLEQRIRLEVLNAISGVEQSRAGVKQAAVARDFAQKRLAAEQQKYELGVVQAFFVLQAQQDLTTAESEVLSQSIAFRRNRLAMLQATGELLDERGVVLR